ncbi:hypothetical protein N8Z37_01260 [Octadecabacter sp.]|nr:hypothetical protein [Octadecabacter sp.]
MYKLKLSAKNIAARIPNPYFGKSPDINRFLNNCKRDSDRYSFSVTQQTSSDYGTIFAYLIDPKRINLETLNAIALRQIRNFDIFADTHLYGPWHLLPHIMILKADLYPDTLEALQQISDPVFDVFEDLRFTNDVVSTNKFFNIVSLLKYMENSKLTEDNINQKLSGIVSNLSNYTITNRFDAVRFIRKTYHLFAAHPDRETFSPLSENLNLVFGMNGTNKYGFFGYSDLSDACEVLDYVFCLKLIDVDNKKFLADLLDANRRCVAVDGGYRFQLFKSYSRESEFLTRRFEADMFGSWFRLLAEQIAEKNKCVSMKNSMKYFGYEW